MKARRLEAFGPCMAIYTAAEEPDFPIDHVYKSSRAFSLRTIVVTQQGFLGEDEDHQATPDLDTPETELINIVSLTVQRGFTQGLFWLLPGQDTTGLISKAKQSKEGF